MTQGSDNKYVYCRKFTQKLTKEKLVFDLTQKYNSFSNKQSDFNFTLCVCFIGRASNNGNKLDIGLNMKFSKQNKEVQ